MENRMFVKINKRVFELTKKNGATTYCETCIACTKDEKCLADSIYITETRITKCRFFNKSTKIKEITDTKQKIKLLTSEETKTINFNNLKTNEKENEKFLKIKLES